MSKVCKASSCASSRTQNNPITWPFAVCGLDMVGPFQMSPCKKTHLLVAIDKFTKWVEVMPISNNEAIMVVKFLKKIIYRFGYPHSIITDNGTNMSLGETEIFCAENGIRLDVASIAHPQANGQVERANQELLKGLKPRLRVPCLRAAGAWVEELPSVCGVSIPHPTDQQSKHLSFWCTVQRQYCQVT